MNDKLPRRTFLLSWLGGLLAGWVGRGQAEAAPSPTPKPIGPNSTTTSTIAIASDGFTNQEVVFQWKVASAASIGP